MNDRLRKSAEQKVQQQRLQEEPGRHDQPVAERSDTEVPQDGEQPASTHNLEAVIHDLRVHQVELELQNEELRATYAQLEQVKDDYQRLYDEAPVGYLSLDSAGQVRRCNGTFAEMAGTGAAGAVGRPLTDFLTVEDRDLFLGRYRAFFRHPEGKSIEVRLARGGEESSRPLWVRLTGGREQQRDRQHEHASSAGAGPDPAPESLLVIVYDITEQKRAAARADVLLREKELLLREVHHRVRNNLSTVTGILSLQIAEMTGSAGAVAVEQARSRVETMLMVYDLLQSSEPATAVDLKRYLHRLLDKLETIHAQSGNITVARDLVSVEVSSSQAINVGIIVNELVTNAFKYAFPDGGSGTVRVALAGAGSERFTLSVSDNGRGLPEDFDLATSTGFGLSVVQGLCDQSEGSVQVRRTEPGVAIDMTMAVTQD